MGGRRAYKRLAAAAIETAAVADMTVEGQGIATASGKRIFVAGAITGETVSFRRTKARRNYDEAELVGVENGSVDRVAPICRYFGTCGGCSLQHVSSAGQLRLKERVLLENLRRIGGVEPRELLPPVASPERGYRRRARLALRMVEGKGRVLVGFSERDSSRITDMLSCETLHPRAAALIEPLSELVGSLSIAQRIPQVEVVVADNALSLLLRVLDPPGALDRERLAAFRERHDCRLLLQTAGPDSIAGLEPERDEGDLWYDSDGLRLGFGPADFIQVNAAVNCKLVARVRQEMCGAPGRRLLDLYCGIGNFTLPLARNSLVLGVEGEQRMVDIARRNAVFNGLGASARFARADLSVAEAAEAWRGERFDAVLLDPPRAGAAAMLAAVAATGADRIVYVSCHPATLARDAGTFVKELGFELVRAGVFDMFPATAHVESLAVFDRA
ncbi:MAG: 23S rRNA (uracil(1939)-C(5))-methyltransferase RlmD [Gammaproteobacteria bacterium]|nr:23S rRNA (uracil(1939)-C(5))-methyltransferase RlmD [Gammaproteobacteria bacterium]